MKCLLKCIGTVFFIPMLLLAWVLFFTVNLAFLPLHMFLSLSGCIHTEFADYGQSTFNRLIDVTDWWKEV